ncbi:PAS domain S-box protein [Methanolobus profundi]|uniref:histidine kinase n=1 Tax=Methanolobus profundi TaxID=487685 RepID=A0A1I4SXF3_9EURY|nr:PAS domain S-box protein [Methanolobus profundi]SFM69059.1 PAS domain S-box-containing protein [Methanolobus profundi]
MGPVVFVAKNGSGNKSLFNSMIENDLDVVEVTPCTSVLTMLETTIPDIIVIDEDINDPEAYRVCQQIKFSEKYHFIPVIFIGVSSFSGDHKLRLIGSGADDYFEGPFDNTSIVTYLNAHLEKRRNFPWMIDKHNKLKEEVEKNGSIEPTCLDPEDEELFKATFQQSAVGIAQMTLEGNFQKVNERFCEIVGYTREELLSMNFLDITYPDRSGAESKMVNKLLEGELDSFEIEKRYIHKKGHLVWVKLYTSVSRDGSGNITSAFAIVADISKQKKAESLLYESESIFRIMYESSGIGIVRMSFNDKVIEQANGAFCKMLGYTEDELIGKHLRDISYFEDLPANIDQQNQLIAGEISSIQMEKRYLHKDGSPVWALLNSNIIFDEQGTPLYYVGNILDITEIKRSQKLLKESEAKYRKYVDNSPYPIFVANSTGRFIDSNPAASYVMGYTKEEIASMSIPDICAPESVDKAVNHFNKVKSGELAFDEFLFMKKDGTRFYMQVEAVKLDEDTFLGICVDTTERKQTEKMLVQAKLLAEDASKSKSEFVANISHELRTPLNIVIGYSDVLLSDMSGELNEKQRKYANNVKNAGSNLLEIVNSLIYIAEIEAGDWDIHLSKFDMLPVIEDMKKLTRATAFKKGVSLDFDVGYDIDGTIADKSKFMILLHHIIGNSIKFTPSGGSIKVRIERSGTYVLVTVTDTGIGIPEEKQEQLFDPFVQLDWSHARSYSGMGIGLALVKELIDMHGGKIFLESRVGEGTTISFTIPQDR